MKKRRLISIILTICIVLNSLPIQAFGAQSEDTVTKTLQTAETKPINNPFKDVAETDWYYDAVMYARQNGIFGGTDTDTFSPYASMTRAMYVTVLGRMAGADVSTYTGSAFTDVPTTTFYAPYVAWAAKMGITSGTGGGEFSPDAPLTREQLAALTFNYFQAHGVILEDDIKITTVPKDLDTISPWARDAVLTLWRAGLFVGDLNGNFNPQDNASRAEAAAFCMRTEVIITSAESELKPPKTPEIKPEKPNSNDSHSDNGGNSGSSDSNDQDYTTYYEVKIHSGSETDAKMFKAGTLLTALPTPYQAGQVFLGWYYDENFNDIVQSDAKLTKNIDLYAKFAEATSLSEGGSPNFVSAQDVATDFSFTVEASGMTSNEVKGKINFKNITDPMRTDESDMLFKDVLLITGNSPIYTVKAENGFTAGHTYQVELTDDSLTFDGQDSAVRYYNFTVKAEPVQRLELSDGIKYLPASALSPGDQKRVLAYTGLYAAHVDSDSGETTYTATNTAGNFTCSASETISVGDTVAVYKGDRPDQRNLNLTNNGDVAYLKITAVNGNTYSYKSAEADDVLFTPDLLPIDLDIGDGVTDKTATSFTIESEKLNFSQGYEDMGLGSATTVDMGDFLAFFTGIYGDAVNSNREGYGKIIGIEGKESETTIITYVMVTEADVLAAMDLYNQTELTEEEIMEGVDEEYISQTIKAQFMDSGFINEAGEYLAGLAVQTDEVKEMLGSDLTLKNYTITYADGTPLGKDELRLMGNIVDKDDGKNINVSITPRLEHFGSLGSGLRVEVAVTYAFDIQKTGSNKKVEVELTAFFETEVLLGFSVNGGAVWKKAWIFPYIYDFKLSGSIDKGIYVGIGVTATANLANEKELWGMPWPKSAKEAAANKKIYSLSESIKKLMEKGEEIFPESEASASGGLAEKYAEFMQDANEEWIELFSVTILEINGSVDPFHILAYGIKTDFVVSANLNVAIGLSFQYEKAQRHTFTLLLFHKKSDSDTVDLSIEQYQFDFYVMGTLGVRAGIRFKATVGLFSTKLDGIGLIIEAGAYARLWGYFYYSLTWEKGHDKESTASGALLTEIGAYLDVKFVAEVLNGKYSYTPTIYTKEWPIWQAGMRENVYDFSYEEKDTPSFEIQKVRTFTLPDSVFSMTYMDLKTGEVEDKALDTNVRASNDQNSDAYDDEKNFNVEMSNPIFQYNPITNTITVRDDGSGAAEYRGSMMITWKTPALVFSSKALSRTIPIEWTDPANGHYIVFETNGGSTVKMLFKLTGTAISAPEEPQKTGYTFGGWYTDNNTFKNAYTVPNVMPESDVTVYAKWIPATNRYTVEHYYETLGGQYEITKTTINTSVRTDDSLNSTALWANQIVRTGFTLNSGKSTPSAIIAADGSTVVKLYYDRNQYTITFTYGSQKSDVNTDVLYTYKYDAPVYAPRLALGGYTFAGWDNNVPKNMPNVHPTYRAIWTPDPNTPYRVEHYVRSISGDKYLRLGGDAGIQSLSGVTGSTVQVSKLTKLDGNCFLYQYAKVGDVEQNYAAISGDGTLVIRLYYDRKSFNVNLDPAGGTINRGNVTSYTYGKAVTLPADVTKNGYTFDGWYVTGDTNQSIVTVVSALDFGDKAYTARWKARTADITLNMNGGTGGSNTVIATYAQEMPAATMPIRTGYTFDGFYDALSGGTKYYNATGESARNWDKLGTQTLYAHWIANSYPVTFDTQGGDSVSSLNIVYDATYGTLPEATRAGYDFAGWYTAVEGGTKVESNTKVTITAGETLYARWTPGTATGYKVEHYTENLGGGYTLAETENSSGTTGAEIDALPKPLTGFTYDNNNAGNVLNGVIAADGGTVLKLYYTRNSYSLTWDAGEGTITGSGYTNGQVKYGTPIIAPQAEKEGYTLDGWDGYNSGMTMPTADRAFYARWTNAGGIAYKTEHYTEKLDGTGYELSPDNTDSLSGTNGEAVSANSKIITGFTFDEGNMNNLATGNVAANGSLILKLYYKRNSYTVTWKNEETTFLSSPVKYGAAITPPVGTPVKTGYAFLNWGDVAETMPAEDVIYSAQWEANQYTVNFNLNYVGAGTAPTSQSATYDSAYGTLPTPPTREDYGFGGWYTQAVGGDKVFNDTKVTIAANHTLYAHWEAGNVKYGVRHTEESLIGRFDQFDFEYLTGVEGQMTKAVAKEPKPGFTVLNFEQQIISADPMTVVEIRYARNLHNLTIKWKNGSPDTIENRGYGKPLNYIGTPSQGGYTFQGWTWEGQDEPVIDISTIAMPDNDLTITANWLGQEVTVKFYTGGDIYNGYLGEKVCNLGSPYGELPVPTLDGENFEGWYTQPQGAGDPITPDTIVAGVEDRALFAKWSYKTFTLSFDLNFTGAKGDTSSKQVTYNDSYGTLPTPYLPSRAYAFKGWNTKADGTGQGIKSTTTVQITEDTTLYALWGYTVSYIKVNHDAMNFMDDQEFLHDVEQALQKNNYTLNNVNGDVLENFLGWTITALDPVVHYTDEERVINIPDRVIENSGAGSVIDGGIGLFACWEVQKYYITYDFNGGERGYADFPETYDYTRGDYGLKLAEPTRVGYTFAGWTGTDLSEPTKQVWISTSFNSHFKDREYTATWTPDTYTLHLNKNGGEYTSGYTAPTQYTFGETTILPTEVDIYKDGYVLAGWYYDIFNEDELLFEIPPVDRTWVGDKSLYAKWVINEGYSITYDLKGGTLETANPDNYKITTETITLNNPERTAYTFSGWTGSNGDTPQTTVTIPKGSTGDKSYTANWSPITYAIHYDLGGGTKEDDLDYTIEDSDGLGFGLTDPAWSGHTFAGWEWNDGAMSQPEGVSISSDGMTVTIAGGTIGDLYFKAKWTTDQKSVTFELDGGILGSETDNPYDYDPDALPDLSAIVPTKEGYTFLGWFTEQSGGVEITDIPSDAPNNYRLYAQWSQNIED